MDIFEALMTRRSIRKYTDEDISDADIELFLKCAMLAPSARNERPWHFVVARSAELRQKLSKTTPYTGMAANAPVVIVVCGDLKEQKSEGFWVQDCAAATENLMLAARGKDIGCVWCGLYPVEERAAFVRGILELPDHIVPFGLVCMGHPAQKFHEEDRFMPERVHHDKW